MPSSAFASDDPALLDLSQAVVVCPPTLSGPERKAVTMLVEEVERRTRIRWRLSPNWPAEDTPLVAVGPAFAAPAFAGPYTTELAAETARAAEGYRLRVRENGSAPAVLVLGNDARGVLFGIGGLLRALRMSVGRIGIARDLEVTTAPRYPLRGHQLGYRDKTNSYCAWDLPLWEQYLRDLIVFGANAIELIPPRSDDRPDSVHFPLPPLQMMAGVARIADDYGLDVWIWYPALDEDYSDPATVEFALAEWSEVFRALPRINALFVPGGDPGRTPPRHLMTLLEKQTASLRRFHPQAGMWISPQGFEPAWMEEFLQILRQQQPDWLTGVVFGPWVHLPLAQFRQQVPDRYPIRHYPDITHTLSCQYPVPDWDVAYALTEGREPINPQPLRQADIFRHTQPHTIGFLTYSEGCNDDVNKAIWSALGWDPDRPVVEILRDYSRYFIGERYADDFAQGLLALERNWQGPLACNAGVSTTLQQFQAMEESASPQDLRNWRFQQALYRAYYDAYVRSRLLYETGLEEQAMDQLRQAPLKGSLTALQEAERILNLAVNQPIAQSWRTRVFQLAEALFQSIRMQLSVRLYRGQDEVRGANLDGIDYPLNQRPWLQDRFASIRALPDESLRLQEIKAILEWGNPGPGGFYDDLSPSRLQPHVVQGPGVEEDPALLRSPTRRYPYRKDPRPLRLAWRGFTGSLDRAPFEMHYPDLDPQARYRVRIVYSEQNTHLRVRLEANEGIEVHPWLHKPEPRVPVEFDIPPQATRHGSLTLRWYREEGRAGNGTGCDLAEIWLLKQQTA